MLSLKGKSIVGSLNEEGGLRFLKAQPLLEHFALSGMISATIWRSLPAQMRHWDKSLMQNSNVFNKRLIKSINKYLNDSGVILVLKLAQI